MFHTLRRTLTSIPALILYLTLTPVFTFSAIVFSLTREDNNLFLAVLVIIFAFCLWLPSDYLERREAYTKWITFLGILLGASWILSMIIIFALTGRLFGSPATGVSFSIMIGGFTVLSLITGLRYKLMRQRKVG